LTTARVEQINAEKRKLGEEGLRVLAVAYRKSPDDIDDLTVETVEKDLVFVGLIGILDPPRPEVKTAVREAKTAGIRVILITGDYGPTALTIARQVGIVETENCTVMTGAQMDKTTEPDLIRLIDAGEIIFARATPEHKMRIVSLLKSMGETVAVTGDGANDAPSLKKADIGISMGIAGTDVARESSDMILLDDSFASISEAIEGGRTVYDNIRKFITYVFAHNWAELIPYLLFVLTGIPLPLLVTQVLAIDLGIEVIPSLALSIEPPESDIMKRPPRSRRETLRSQNDRQVILPWYIRMRCCSDRLFLRVESRRMGVRRRICLRQPDLPSRNDNDVCWNRFGAVCKPLRLQKWKNIYSESRSI